MKIVGIRRGKGNRSVFVYAKVTDATGTVISADLPYVIGACLERGYKIDNWQEVKGFLEVELAAAAYRARAG